MSPIIRADALSTILDDLGRLEDARLFRQTRCVSGDGTNDPVAGVDRAVALCSNDYLGLAGDTRLAEAAHEVALHEGFGAGAARLISGTRAAHEVLERDVAAFCGTEAALTFSSGYAANLAVLGALLDEGDLAISDARNHASLIDGLRLTRATRRIVPHADAAAVRAALADAASFRRVVVVTEGLFSMDGDVAPLADLLQVTRDAGALLYVDDAHGTGVLGPTGGGALECAGLADAPDVVRIGTFGKAFGAAGAFVAAVQPVVDLVVNRGRAFVFTTATPPPVAAACSAALRIASDEPWRRERCLALSARLRAGLAERGVRTLPGDGPIVPVVLGDPGAALDVSQRLAQDHGLFVPAVRPPTVPPGTSRLRLTTSASHDAALIDHAVHAIAECVA